MYQHPRGSPVTASPANSPRTNPTRTNNPRDPEQGHSSERGSTEGFDVGLQTQQSSSQGKEAKTKLNQIIQFNVELDETDALRDDLRVWKTCDAFDKRPPPLIIEIFVDTEELTNNQTLVIIDDQGKRWDVVEALNASGSSSAGRTSHTERTQVILERWKIGLGDSASAAPTDLGSLLPTIYKKSIVLFRSLFTYAKFLPAWKFAKRLPKLRSNPSSIKVNYRLINGAQVPKLSNADPLTTPLFEGGGRIVENFSFGATESPAGSFSIEVSYRTNCEFRVDDSEALLSSHFIGMDEQFFKPSLASARTQNPPYLKGAKEVGSLPPERGDRTDRPDRSQAYGSLSTFHQVGPPASSSPISALRAARDFNAPSPSESPPQKIPPTLRSAQGSRSSIRSTEGVQGVHRRPSVSFMPFKASSLSASPSQADQSHPSSPRGSIGRTSNLSVLAEARNRFPVGPLSPSSPRGPPSPHENAIASSASSSPKPALVSRYSSSFGHRRARLSSGGGSKTEDDNNSSGKTSLNSSAAQPGSGILAEGGGSSGSIQTDDDNISEFLKLLDTKKDLKSFQAPNNSASVDASTRRTTTALSKFQRMRDSNAALSDSMSSSMLLHRSSSSSSRQLSSVPPMIAGTSISTSSSPGKPISPHTPHTPAIPSRLSANSIAEYPHRSRSGNRHRLSREEHETQLEDVSSESTTRDAGTNAIDIPTSPRPYHPSYRRSSSVAQQERAIPVEDETGDLLPFGMRSASLGADDRPPLSLSALLALQDGLDVAMQPIDGHDRPYGPVPNPSEAGIDMSRQRSPSIENQGDCPQAPRNTAGSLNSPYRLRFSRGGGRGFTPPQGSSSSLAGDRGSGSGSSDQRGGRHSFTRPGSNFEEEEPLLFAMSDFGAGQSRRSLEEGRGGSSAAASERTGGDSGSCSRRGSRRGGSAGRLWS
ncbi:MAG: autophagy protein 13 [Pleopsidium flavum]|nr:MAG: autophagy protein 13 [Pleopsidium flavum]